MRDGAYRGDCALAKWAICTALGLSASGAAQTAPGSVAALHFTFSNTRGGVEDLTLDRFQFEGRPLAADALRTRVLAPGVTEVTSQADSAGEWRFAVADESGYYGFGERFNRLNHSRTILHNSSRDVPGNKGALTYQPMPFFMSLRGYGLWVDTFSEATFDLNVSDPSRIGVTVFASRLRFVLFEGPGFPTILDRFTALIGRPQLPPYWAFAPWKARDYYRDARDVYEDADRYRELGLPASVLLIDSPWATNYNTYEFNRKQFDDPEKMIAHIHDRGYKLVLWHTSWINRQTAPPYELGLGDKVPRTAAANFAEAEREKYFLQRPDGSTYIARWWKGEGSLIDFTNAGAKKWWQSQLMKAIAAGADGFKDDDAEGNFLGEVKFASGEETRLVRNRYAVDYHNAVAEALREGKGKDWVLFQRTATVGSHTLPLFWSGDNDATFSVANGLPSVVAGGLNAGLSGISFWVSDLGGYNKSERYAGDEVLFIRWTQYSALSPGMEVMSGMNLGPWDYGEEALRIFRQYSVLHMSLFPYRYAAAQESARTGLPMMRALVLMHQDDPVAREAETAYYFGPDLLVAPMLAPVTQRFLYFPEGDWVDYWSGARMAGKRTATVEAPLDRIPLFVRAGAILPKIPEDVMTLVPQREFKDASVRSLDDRRVYEIYPGALRAVTDFEGRTLTPDGNGGLVIAGAPARVTLRWRFHAPTAVSLDGRPLSLSGGSVEFEHSGTSRLRWQ